MFVNLGFVKTCNGMPMHGAIGNYVLDKVDKDGDKFEKREKINLSNCEDKTDFFESCL